MPLNDAVAQIAALPCWRGRVEIAALDGGMTNRNYRVECAGSRYVARLGQDIPAHGIVRWHELAAARAAHAAGLSPEVVYAAPGVMVSRFVDGRTLQPQDLRDPLRLDVLLGLLRRCHRALPALLHGPVLMFWVFQVIRNYLALLAQESDALLQDRLARFAGMALELERAVGPVDIVFGHNDLLAANFLDDGARVWLIDWDYAGFNSPLFDLANLSVNNGFDAAHDRLLLERYFAEPADRARWRGFVAMRCASALRETLWGAVSHHRSEIDFDYAGYARGWLERVEAAWAAFRSCAV